MGELITWLILAFVVVIGILAALAAIGVVVWLVGLIIALAARGFVALLVLAPVLVVIGILIWFVPCTSNGSDPNSVAASSSTVPALDVLASIPIENEHKGSPRYQRDLFSYGTPEGSACATRQRVLARDSLVPVEADGCTVLSGRWLSPYDQQTWSDPSDVDIDHVVSLKEAWDSGAWAWTPERCAAFANDLTDPRTLVVVTDSINQAKGDKDPSNWLPPSDVCGYLGNWVAVKARWSLSMDQSEAGRIRNVLRDRCAGLMIEPRTQDSANPRPLAAAPPQERTDRGRCLIKGNIPRNGRIYHVPGSSSYSQTKIDESKGERWFCSEEEAKAAGWRAPRR